MNQNGTMEMNDTLLRHWRMLREIPRYPRRIDAASLLEKLRNAGFNTTLRTIQRDLIKFSAVLPLLSDDSKPQGWSWQAHAQQLDLPALEPHAALIFHLAEKHLRSILPASTLDYLSPWFTAARGVLDSQYDGLSSWRNKVRVLAAGQPLQQPAIDSEVQTTMAMALLENRRVSLSYRPRNAESDQEYVVNPLGLVVRDRTSYYVCTLWDYPDIKQLALHRMHSATLLDEETKRPKGFSLDKYIDEGEFGWPAKGGQKVKLVAEFAGDAATMIQEKPLDNNQEVTQCGNNLVRLAATVPNTNELRWWLLSLGDQVEVISPIALRKAMRQIVANLHRRYSAQ